MYLVFQYSKLWHKNTTVKEGFMFYTWLVTFVILLIIEIVTFNFVTIWFALGAVIAMFSSFFTSDAYIQIIVFVIASAIFLIATRPIVNKYLKKEPVKTNLDMVIGKVGIVTQNISRLEPGEVKVDGKYWTAISKERIKKDSKVKILAIEGVKLIVESVTEE